MQVVPVFLPDLPWHGDMTVAAWSVLSWAILYLQCCWENKYTDFTHKALERWTYSRGPVKGERGTHVPCWDFKTHLLGFWGESHIPVGILLFYYYCTFLLWCCSFNSSLRHLSPFQLSIPARVDMSTFPHATTGFPVKWWLRNMCTTDNQLYLKQTGSLHVSGKLPTYPSPKPT